MKKSLLIIAGIALSACSSVDYAPITSDPVGFRSKAGFDATRVTDVRSVPVRTVSGRGREEVEITGADCTAQSEELVARFTAPAYIEFPQINGRPSDMAITCRSNGLNGERVLDAELRKIAAPAQSSLVASLIVIGATSAMAGFKQDYVYVQDNVTAQMVRME